MLELGNSKQGLRKQSSVLDQMLRSTKNLMTEYLDNFYLRGRNIKVGLELSLAKKQELLISVKSSFSYFGGCRGVFFLSFSKHQKERLYLITVFIL